MTALKASDICSITTETSRLCKASILYYIPARKIRSNPTDPEPNPIITLGHEGEPQIITGLGRKTKNCTFFEPA